MPSRRNRAGDVEEHGLNDVSGDRHHRSSRVSNRSSLNPGSSSRRRDRDDGSQHTSGGGSTGSSSYMSRRRQQQQQPFDDADDTASSYSRGSARSAGSGPTLNPEDELERIRESRARRMRNDRSSVGDTPRSKSPRPNPLNRSNSPRPGDSGSIGRSSHSSGRERRRENRGGGTRGDGSSPRGNTAPTSISRKELEDAGLVRKESRSVRPGAQSIIATRKQSDNVMRPRQYRPPRDGGADDISSRSSNKESESMSAYARARRERMERTSEVVDDDDDAYDRSQRRERTMKDRERSGGRTSKESSGDELLSAYAKARAARKQTEKSGTDYSSSRRERSGRRERKVAGDFDPRGDNDSHLGRKESLRSRSSHGEEPRSSMPKSRSLADFDDQPNRYNVSEENSQPLMKSDSRIEFSDSLGRESKEDRSHEVAEAGKVENVVPEATEAVKVIHDPQEETRLDPTEKAQMDKMMSAITELYVSTIEMNEYEKIPELEFDSDVGDDSVGSSWSIKVQAVSAVDLPLFIVQNQPLCPILKIGLVKVPLGETLSSGFVSEKLGNRSIETVASARVRSTTTKVLSRRDNGSVDFHQHLRWDSIKHPMEVALVVELCARAVRTPKNYVESPPAFIQEEEIPENPNKSGQNTPRESSPARQRATDEDGNPVRGVSRTLSGGESSDDGAGPGGLRGLWRKATNRKTAELEAAQAAAAVARMLVDGDKPPAEDTRPPPEQEESSGVRKAQLLSETDYNVALSRARVKRRKVDLTRDLRLGCMMLPLTTLPLDKATNGNEVAEIEQWFPIEITGQNSTTILEGQKQPSVLLKVSFCSPEILDKSETEVLDTVPEDVTFLSSGNLGASLRNSVRETRVVDEQLAVKKNTDPHLRPGVIDFCAVIGCKQPGKLPEDDGSRGWVNGSPTSEILEQFPPNNEFYQAIGRNSLLPEMLQWFCFPEGYKFWRGVNPPTYSDMNLKRFSGSSPANVAASIAAFDACLNSTTSFSWFVIASNSDEYGSKLAKTYVAIIRFYAPLCNGEDDLWIPMAIALSSSLPIIGVLESILLRICEDFANSVGSTGLPHLDGIHTGLKDLALKYQRPLSGAVNCSVPFLDGERFLLTLPPPSGLPPLPHGRAVVSVCRLLGAQGLNYILAAVLTECKILIHSQEIADIVMVAEVVTSLCYPFSWSLPYVPILPIGMLEFVEAPLSYLLGIPSCNLQHIDPTALDDVVTIDLDNGFTTHDQFERKSSKQSNKYPTPLPATTAANISKAVYKLLRTEEEMEDQFGGDNVGEQPLPRLETETLAEREFRVTIAVEVCGLLRGYQECIGTVFNRDKFLKVSPALFEPKRGTGTHSMGARKTSHVSKTISVRSKRFLALLVNTQNFQQLLESLQSEDLAFFHEIMDSFEDGPAEKRSSRATDPSSTNQGQVLSMLVRNLQKMEDKIPTYRVDKGSDADFADSFDDDDESDFDFQDFPDFPTEDMNYEDNNIGFSSFTGSLLRVAPTQSSGEDSADSQKDPDWAYTPLFQMEYTDEDKTETKKVKLKEAIGERRFRAWKLAQEQKNEDDLDLPMMSDTIGAANQGAALDITSLVSAAQTDTSTRVSVVGKSKYRPSPLPPDKQRVADAKNRDTIRRCLDNLNKTAYLRRDDSMGSGGLDNGRDLTSEAEKALHNPSAQQFLLSILAQRSRLENQRSRAARRMSAQQTSSRLNAMSFDCLVRLCCAMLDACMEYKEFESAYRLLTVTAGFVMVIDTQDEETDQIHTHVVPMTSRIGIHPIFADLCVWQTVMDLHLQDRKLEKKPGTKSDDDTEENEDQEEVEFEAAIATLYEMVGYDVPAEELSRFAMRASEDHGYFCNDKGRQLLMLARRISRRRDQAESRAVNEVAEIEMVSQGKEGTVPSRVDVVSDVYDEGQANMVEIGWCHPAAPSSQSAPRVSNDSSVEFMKRSPVTALASFGLSMVVSGGLDGSVFLAHSIRDESYVRGVHLDWGSASRAGAGTYSDGEYGVGAISCLATTLSYGHQVSEMHGLDGNDAFTQEEMLASMEGSRIVAGTTAGDLRVWSIKDVLSSLLATMDVNETVGMGASNPKTRLRFSLRGRALSGHRGGVTCIDTPNHVYRPDTLVSGGADGLIKLWSLRASAGRRADRSQEQSNNRNRGGDALSVLAGHSGRVMCINTAWHGDRLLSGGSDRTLRVWDIASSACKCLDTLVGHQGWVTSVQYWGTNTIVSASTDRSIALWDARVKQTPLFQLRSHRSPVSTVLVGDRTDPVMVSAGADGTVASWDFRALSSAEDAATPMEISEATNSARVVRHPVATMSHGLEGQRSIAAGQVLLARGFQRSTSSVLSIGSDTIVKEWQPLTGKLIEETPSGHCDAISDFFCIGPNEQSGNQDSRGKEAKRHGCVSSSWDGTVRMKLAVPQQ